MAARRRSFIMPLKKATALERWRLPASRRTSEPLRRSPRCVAVHALAQWQAAADEGILLVRTRSGARLGISGLNRRAGLRRGQTEPGARTRGRARRPRLTRMVV